jgi:hypothetical protein
MKVIDLQQWKKKVEAERHDRMIGELMLSAKNPGDTRKIKAEFVESLKQKRG